MDNKDQIRDLITSFIKKDGDDTDGELSTQFHDIVTAKARDRINPPVVVDPEVSSATEE